MCMSEYDGDIAAKSSVYSETESSLVSAENNAMYHEENSKRKREDKEMKLQQFQNKTKANAARKLREETSSRKKEEESKRLAAREKQIKAKEYAKKARDIVSQKGSRSTRMTKESQENNSPNTGMGENSNFHKEIIKESQGIVSIDNSKAQSQGGITSIN